MILVCMSKSGVHFQYPNRAEYGDMYMAIVEENDVYKIDIGNGVQNYILGGTYWRPAKGLEKDLFYSGIRKLNNITYF